MSLSGKWWKARRGWEEPFRRSVHWTTNLITLMSQGLHHCQLSRDQGCYDGKTIYRKLLFYVRVGVRRWQHWIIALSCFCVSPGGRSLTSLWCKASSLGLLLLHWRRLTSLCLLAHDERAGPPDGPRHEFFMCVCIYVYVCVPPVAEKAGRADIAGMCVSENRERPFILKRWGSGPMGSHTLIGD